ncbi:DUF2088 domain-containing protein [Anaerotruncus massiliensis (ex Liu et al. 2021)]|uniref:DUF2088 domain-containing protein n=2 Tax=Anaerotruncus TaxID=244127 RepID=A0A498CQM2_9FIRM|nr:MULTISPECIES: lactate racemase domain-containing protein [Anaerotruncus]MBC3937725.1 DUF2088 domain-containing protein [Anaerotruncus massiliensis (ex Togo et al. 2019)]RLL14828.1 DUF2088 domain-containing protein [Anaerotruncus massiliensis (ex Liu et al. 2021)]
MDVYGEILRGTALPRFSPLCQRFDRAEVPDAGEAVRRTLCEAGVLERLRPGDTVALTAGSRQIDRLPEILRALAEAVRSRGALPFLVPAMGSHGGATAEGQRALLARYGVTEETVGAPVRSCMDTVEVGLRADGFPVRIDRLAAEADWIVPVGRVKPHTDFRGRVESGVMKMLVVGLGKRYGADLCHSAGFSHMAENIWECGRVILQNARVAFGVALVENACHRLRVVEAIPAERIPLREPELLEQAKALMPRIPFDPLDALFVRRMGKELSGAGMDPNVTGRSVQLGVGPPHAARLAVLDLTAHSAGNAAGMGNADFITERLRGKIDFTPIYVNGLTCRDPAGMRMPCVMPDDRSALLACLHTCGAAGPFRAVLIEDTAHIETLWASEALLAEARENPALTAAGPPRPLPFDGEGALGTLAFPLAEQL